MSILLTLVVLTAAGADNGRAAKAGSASPKIEASRVEGPSPATGPMISYEIEYVTTNQIAWRGKFDPWLKPIARQGGAVIWSASAATLQHLMDYFQADSTTRINPSPKVITPAGGGVRILHGEEISYVAHLERIADGPINQATRLEFKPEVATLHQGVITRLSSGIKDNMGLRVHLAIERDHLVSFQTSTYSEMVVPNTVGAVVDGQLDPKPAKLNGTIQVPIVDSTRVEGDWLIPLNGALIVGVGTGQDKRKILGYGEIRPEELVIIQYQHLPGETPTPPGTTLTTTPRVRPRQARARGAAAN